MRLFKDNLLDYEKQMDFTATDVAEITELPRSTIENMEKGNLTVKDTVQLCTKLGIEYSSIYSNEGFKQIPVLDQYDKYPINLRRMVTRSVYHKIMNLLKKEKGIEKLTIFSPQLRGRFKTGCVAFNRTNLEDLQKFSECVLTKEEFLDLLASDMYKKIPNYNYNLMRCVFGLSHSDLGKALNITPSGSSNWGGKSCVSIPDIHIQKIVSFLPGMNKNKFVTCPMTEKELKKYTCTVEHLSGSDVFPDPPSDEVECTNIAEDVTTNESVQLTDKLTSDQALKLYSVLNSDQKREVNELIYRLFFG